MNSSTKQNNPTTKNLKAALKAFFEAIVEEASENPSFMAKLENIFTPSSADNPSQKKESSPQKSVLNILEILHESGENGLKERLDSLTTNDLIKLCSQESVRKPKDAKSLERSELVELLVQVAINRIKQGNSFIKRS